MAVAGAIVNGIRSGDEIILPHAQSRELFGAIPQLDPTFVEIVNQGVRRRHDWNRPS
jgi:hypothetical protein